MMTEISAFWKNNMYLLNSTAKVSGIIHHISAEYIILPMAIQSIERGLIYQTCISSRNTLLPLFVILKLAILCLGPQNSKLPDFWVKNIPFL